jgi:RimJ/RimL family protein N-acetyltransferase
MKNPFLIGERIYLRPLEREDAPLLTSWANHPESRAFLRRPRPTSLAQQEEELARRPGEDAVVMGIACKDDDALLGRIALREIDARHRQAELGLFIGPVEQWGKGYGTEATRLVVRYAFDTLNLHRVQLHVQADNARAVRIYERLGFVREGLLRQDRYREGRYVDSYVMAVLRDEWRG